MPDFLNLSERLEQPEIEIKPEFRKSPGTAFGLSLLCPGLGHFYLGNNNQALVNLVIFGISLAVMLFVSPTRAPMPWGLALQSGIVIYIFAFVDAYYSAREINAGVAELLIGSNPRIAAMLNLLTSGFGYFYLGDRTKGILAFIFLRIGSGLLAAVPGVRKMVGVLLISALVATAVDAYLLAKKQLNAAAPSFRVDLFAPSLGLTPVLPVALASLLILNFLGIILLGFLAPSYRNIDISHASVEHRSGGIIYKNPKYGVEMTVPAQWNYSISNPRALIGANNTPACSVSLLPQPDILFRSPERFAHSLVDELLKRNRNFQLKTEHAARLGDLNGYEVEFAAAFANGIVSQRYVIVRKGLTIYAFVITIGGYNPECLSEAESVQRSVRLR